MSPPIPRAGYAYSRIVQPHVLGASAPPTRSWPAARPGVAFASGMGAIHAALASQLQAGDRVVAPHVAYGSTRTQLVDTFTRFGVRSISPT